MGVAFLTINEATKMALVETLLVTDRAMPTSTKVAVHHAARFAAWKDILQIGVGNAMIGMNPRCNLQKLSPLRALCLAMKHLIGSWT